MFNPDRASDLMRRLYYGEPLPNRVDGPLWLKEWVVEPTHGRNIALVWLAMATGLPTPTFPADTRLSDMQIITAVAHLIVFRATDDEIIALAAAGGTPIILAAVKREIEGRAVGAYVVDNDSLLYHASVLCVDPIDGIELEADTEDMLGPVGEVMCRLDDVIESRAHYCSVKAYEPIRAPADARPKEGTRG